MKFIFLFLIFFVVSASCSIIAGQDLGQKPASKEFLLKQRNLLRLLNHVTMPNVHDDQVQIGKSYSISANVDKFLNTTAVKEFLHLRTVGTLPKNAIFTVTNRRLRDEAIALFHVLFYAKDFETFYKTACWAREHMNEGTFVYALTIAVLHRPDCRGIILPPPYEISPSYFLNNEVIQKAQRVKMQGRVLDKKVATASGVHQVGNTIFINSNYSGWYSQMNEEVKLTYFTEDVGLNSYHFYFHADYPWWMRGPQFGLNKDKRGELFYHFYKQLLARYYMERLSNGLGEIPRLSWNRPVATGFMSNIRHPNGMSCPSRSNFYSVKSEKNVWKLQDVKDCERRIRDAVRSGFVLSEEGGFVSIKHPEGINIIGNIVQGNGDSVNPRFYRHCTTIAKKLLGNGERTTDVRKANPGVMEHYQTAMRDPAFYQLYKRVIRSLIKYKETLQPYTREELIYPGVKIESVQCDKLVTFFDFFDIDITNAVARNEEEMKTDKDKLMFVAHQYRLNHKPFDVRIRVNSEKTTDAVVRIFLGPKYDSKGNMIDINENRNNFVLIDKFMQPLQVGKNTIIRNSREFVTTRKDKTCTRDLLKKIDDCLRGNQEFMLDMSEAHNLFPDRLILPRGKKAGMVFQLFVTINPHIGPKVALGKGYDMTISAGVGTGARFLDDRALGYPLDRLIDEYNFMGNNNMFMTDVIIFHKSLKDLNNRVVGGSNRLSAGIDNYGDNTFLSDKDFMMTSSILNRNTFYGADSKEDRISSEMDRSRESGENLSGGRVMGNYGGFMDRNTEFMDRNAGTLDLKTVNSGM